MTMTGADVEGLRALATDFTRGADELQQLGAELGRALDAADDWQGPDATRAKDQWGELARTRMTGVAGALEAAGALLEREATEQEVGSAAGTTAGTTAAHPSLLAQLDDWFDVGRKLDGARRTVAGLLAFFRSLGQEAFFARTRDGIKALTTLAGTGNKAPKLLLDALGAAGLTRLAGWAKTGGKVLGRISPVATIWSGVQDLRDGGGHTGWRGDVTRGLAGVGVAGAVTLVAGSALGVVAAVPLAAAAGAAVTVYSVWGAGNLAYDKIPLVHRGVDAAAGAVGSAWTQTWQGARSVLEVSKTYARGLLGPAPAPAGAR